MDNSATWKLAFSPDRNCYLTFMLRRLCTGKILAPNLTSHTIMALLSRTSLNTVFYRNKVSLINPNSLKLSHTDNTILHNERMIRSCAGCLIPDNIERRDGHQQIIYHWIWICQGVQINLNI